MADLELPRQPRRRGRHRPVQRRRAEAAAEHQQAQRSGAAGETGRGGRQCGDLRAHRVAGRRRPALRGKGAGKRLQDPVRDARQQRVGQPGDSVLLVDHQRQREQPGGDPAGPGDEATHTEHRGRPPPAQRGERLQQRDDEPERSQQPAEQAVATQPGNADPVDLDAGARHQFRFQPASRSEPADRQAAFAQPRRDRQRREDMTAGAAGHDDDGRAHARTSAG